MCLYHASTKTGPQIVVQLNNCMMQVFPGTMMTVLNDHVFEMLILGSIIVPLHYVTQSGSSVVHP